MVLAWVPERGIQAGMCVYGWLCEITLFGTNNVGVASRVAESSRRCLEDVSIPEHWPKREHLWQNDAELEILPTRIFAHAGTTCSSHVRISAFAFPS